MAREEGIFPVLARKGKRDQLVSYAAKCTEPLVEELNTHCQLGTRFHQTFSLWLAAHEAVRILWGGVLWRRLEAGAGSVFAWARGQVISGKARTEALWHWAESRPKAGG